VSGVAVVLNARAGDGTPDDAARRIEAAIAAAGREGRILRPRSGEEIAECARRAVREGCSVLAAAGGDGTVNAVASVAMEADVPLGVLPLGTLNHFARDLGIPRDLDGALGVMLGGVVRRVDVGEAGGRIFLNNASLGVYPRIVRMRERLRERGLGKWLGAAWATLAVLRGRPFAAVRVTGDGEPIVRRTPFVLVGNNAYHMEGIRAGRRESLDGGRLWIYVTNASGRRSLLWLAVRILVGGASELEAFPAATVAIELRRPRLRVALDGELVELASPVECRLRPRALRVLVAGE
jgi:diacylglycerol kinase family enzyme